MRKAVKTGFLLKSRNIALRKLGNIVWCKCFVMFHSGQTTKHYCISNKFDYHLLKIIQKF